ncbi:MAG TPA: type II secretion system protein N [Gammaproteobacteria bacterium]|nr:type II secretion system protein N [Gammaproteobacteria bacterium]
MRKRWVRLLLLGLLVYTLTLVVQLPASWALYWARGSVPHTVRWHGVEGTVWNPRIARLTVRLPGGPRVPAGPVAVDFHPAGLFTGHLGAGFRAELLGGEIHGQMAAGMGGKWRIPQIQGRLDLASLADVDSRIGLAEPRGHLLFAGKDLSGQQLPEQGSLRASLEGFQTALLPTDGPVGEYALQAKVAGPGRLQGTVKTVKGRMLGIKGRFRLDLKGRRYRFDGESWASSVAPQAVQDVLSLLGPVHNGHVAIHRQGRFR